MNTILLASLMLLTVTATPLAFADTVDPLFKWADMKNARYVQPTNTVYFSLHSGENLEYYYFQAWVNGNYVSSDTIRDLKSNHLGLYTAEIPEPFNELKSFQLITKANTYDQGGAWFLITP